MTVESEYRIECGHVLDVLRGMPDESVQCVVTSPPYWGLRDYKIEPQVWGGSEACAHDWGEEQLRRAHKRLQQNVFSFTEPELAG